MTNFLDIISAFDAKGLRSALADALGVEPNRIAVFKRRDSIPPAYWKALIAYAPTVGVEGITAELLTDLAARKADAAA